MRVRMCVCAFAMMGADNFGYTLLWLLGIFCDSIDSGLALESGTNWDIRMALLYFGYPDTARSRSGSV